MGSFHNLISDSAFGTEELTLIAIKCIFNCPSDINHKDKHIETRGRKRKQKTYNTHITINYIIIYTTSYFIFIFFLNFIIYYNFIFFYLFFSLSCIVCFTNYFTSIISIKKTSTNNIFVVLFIYFTKLPNERSHMN